MTTSDDKSFPAQPKTERKLEHHREILEKYGLQEQSVPICIGCHKTPDEIKEYIEMADLEDMTPIQYVRSEEGTYNPKNGHFACTECYIRMGCPSSPTGWVAP
jgi:hypothetical protein